VTVIMLALSPASGAAAARRGPWLQMSAGPLGVAAGLALMARAGPRGSYVGEVLPAVVVLGFGLVATVAPLTATVLAAVPDRHSGVASAINNEVARAAALLAVAVVPGLAGVTGDTYLHPATLSAAFHRAVFIAAGACAAGGVLAAATIRNRRPPAGAAAGAPGAAGTPPPPAPRDG